ncbi:MAG: hypothetical protein PUI57_04985 [Oscillospiraceae bacterium]|nr:hypothetical protein [Oscillospiraceae bacterium]
MKNIRRNRAATALVLAALILVTALVMKLPDWYEAWKAPARTIGEVTQLDESLLRTANTKQILTLLEDPDTEWVNLSAQTDTQAARDAAWDALADWSTTAENRLAEFGYDVTESDAGSGVIPEWDINEWEALYQMQDMAVPISPLEFMLALPSDHTPNETNLKNLRPLDTGWQLVSLRGNTESGAASAMLWSVTFQGYGTFDEVQVLFDPQTSVIYRVSVRFSEWYTLEQALPTEEAVKDSSENQLAYAVGICYWNDERFAQLTMREYSNAIWLDYNGPAGGDALMG